MKKLFAIALMLALVLDARGVQTNLLTFDTRDYSQVAQPNIRITLSLLGPNPRTYGGVFIRQQPVSKFTDTAGIGYFTNVLWGTYRADIAGQPGTSFLLYVGTNTLGTVNAASLVTNSAAVPPSDSTLYYSKAQIDALLAALPGGSGTVQTNVSYTAVTNLSEFGALTNNHSVPVTLNEALTIGDGVDENVIAPSAGQLTFSQSIQANGPFIQGRTFISTNFSGYGSNITDLNASAIVGTLTNSTTGNAATATTASLVSATGNAVTTNDQRTVVLPYASVGEYYNTITFTNYLRGGTNATLTRKNTFTWTNATSGMVYYDLGILTLAGFPTITNAAHADLDSDYAAIANDVYTVGTTMLSFTDGAGSFNSLGTWSSPSSNTVAATTVTAAQYNDGRIAQFGPRVSSVVNGSGLANDSSAIQVNINEDSENHKIGLAIINKFPQLTEIYLENQSGGSRQTELVLGATANGQAFIGSSGLMRIIDPVSAFPHNDLMTWNRTNQFVTSFGTLLVTNKSGGTIVSLISSNGSTISGIGITNGNVTIPGTLGVTGATTAGVVTVGSIGGSATGLSNFSANAVSAAFTNANVFINGDLTLGSVASGQKFLYLHDGTDAGRISYGAGSFEFDYGIQAQQFSGGGQNLTNLNASAISGTMNLDELNATNFAVYNNWDARLATNVTGDDTAYAASWNGNTNVPTKNAVYDKIETIGGGVSVSGATPSSRLVAGVTTTRWSDPLLHLAEITAVGGTLLNYQGSSGYIVGTAYAVSATTTSSQVVGYSSSAAALNNIYNQGGYTPIVLTTNFYFGAVARMTNSTNVRFCVGAAGGGTSIFTTHASTANGLWFRYSTNSGNWFFCSGNNSTHTENDTGIAADTSFHRFEIFPSDLSGTNFTGRIDGVQLNVTNACIPTSTLGYQVGLITLEAVVKGFEIKKIQYEFQY